MLEGRTFKNESAGTWGYHHFLALPLRDTSLEAILGYLPTRLVETRCVTKVICLLPGGEGGVKFLDLCHCQVTATSSMPQVLVLILFCAKLKM